ncbi:hypothetical protein BCR42DRAFT_57990 [Absidia repens]|uniref:Uncharacterized protein n=1 Tax=Absidia repens TaxID=90262 RepID=A0A1X2IFI3_9FUNG|nr:hypothetical protein BCR42DRAFT_57990 [Absidia repens]
MAKFWRFDDLVQNVDPTQSTMAPRTPSYPPQKSSSRILLVETNNNNYTMTSPPQSSTSSSSRQRVERLTLQEVSTTTSPTYYGAASLSYRNSVASTASTQSNLSTRSRPMSFSPPPSPNVADGNSGVLCASPTTVSPLKSHRPSWTSSMDETTSAAPYPPFMIGSTLPLGWLRPSLSPTALLETNHTGHPSHFVCLGFGQVKIMNKYQKPKLNDLFSFCLTDGGIDGYFWS